MIREVPTPTGKILYLCSKGHSAFDRVQIENCEKRHTAPVISRPKGRPRIHPRKIVTKYCKICQKGMYVLRKYCSDECRYINRLRRDNEKYRGKKDGESSSRKVDKQVKEMQVSV